MWLQKISIPTLWMVTGNSKGVGWGGVSKPNIFKGKNKAKPDFPKRWGVQTKNHPRWGYGYFLEPHNIKTSQKLT